MDKKHPRLLRAAVVIIIIIITVNNLTATLSRLAEPVFLFEHKPPR